MDFHFIFFSFVKIMKFKSLNINPNKTEVELE